MNSLFDRDTWQEIFGSIGQNKVRTIITVIGVMWGIFLYIVLSGIAKGVDNGFENPNQEGEHKGEAFSFKYEVLHGYLYIFDFTYHTDKRFSLSSVEIELLQSSLNTFNDINDDYLDQF